MEKVVVTGIGALACNGNNVHEFWNSLVNGNVGYLSNEEYLPSDFPFKLCGIVKNLKFERYLTESEIRTYDRSALLALTAACMAIEDAQLDFSLCNRDKVSVILGSTCGTNLAVESYDFVNKWYGSNSVNEVNIAQYRHSDIPNAVSNKFSLKGSSYLEGTACASGSHSIGEAYDLITLGEADVVICGGAEALNLLPLLGFKALHALAKNKCAPYDKNRDGIVIGEGAGIIILESETHALERKAKIYTELSGWSINCDAENITAPVEDGTRCKELIISCLKNAGKKEKDIDYISLHGTGTPKNDLAEGNGIRLALGKRGGIVPVSSIKSMIGHTFGAAGALGSIAAILSITKGFTPPNMNLEHIDELLKLNLISKPHTKADIKLALSLSFGFGGCNVAILFNKYINK